MLILKEVYALTMGKLLYKGMLMTAGGNAKEIKYNNSKSNVPDVTVQDALDSAIISNSRVRLELGSEGQAAVTDCTDGLLVGAAVLNDIAMHPVSPLVKNYEYIVYDATKNASWTVRIDGHANAAILAVMYPTGLEKCAMFRLRRDEVGADTVVPFSGSGGEVKQLYFSKLWGGHYSSVNSSFGFNSGDCTSGIVTIGAEYEDNGASSYSMSISGAKEVFRNFSGNQNMISVAFTCDKNTQITVSYYFKFNNTDSSGGYANCIGLA